MVNVDFADKPNYGQDIADLTPPPKYIPRTKKSWLYRMEEKARGNGFKLKMALFVMIVLIILGVLALFGDVIYKKFLEETAQ